MKVTNVTDDSKHLERATHYKAGLNWARFFMYVFLIIMGVLTVIPILAIVLTAFKTPMELIQNGGFGLPKLWRWSNFAEAWFVGKFQIYFANSLIIAVVVTLSGLLASLLSAYSLTIQRVPWANFWLFLFMLGLIIPAAGVVIPLYYNLHFLGLINTRLGLILPQVAMSTAFGVFFLRPSLLDFPAELIESAKIDGGTDRMILWKIIVPIIKPALAALTVLFFMWTWNDFILALVLTYSEQIRTLPLGLALFQGKYTNDVSLTAAGTIIVIAPVIVVYLLFQRQLIEGVTAGSVKG